jgi:SAM-dependent methyltransferase
MDKYLEVNKSLWNGKTALHVNSDFYDVEGFKRGKSSLNPAELIALGDVSGKSLLHLQCHFGMDTLSLARLGAQVTGVDLSDKAIEAANQLNDELKLGARFINCDVYSLPDLLNDKFDIVFTSYGTIGWLPDLNKWAKVVSHFLKPGGVFFIAEFHPVMWLWDSEYSYIKYPYFDMGPIVETNTGTYAAWDADFRHESYEFSHTLSDVFMALQNAGLIVISFEEFPYSYYNCFSKAVKGTDGYWRIAGMEDKIPMMYSIKAIKK